MFLSLLVYISTYSKCVLFKQNAVYFFQVIMHGALEGQLLGMFKRGNYGIRV